MAKFRPGHRKLGGRKKGTENTATKELRELRGLVQQALGKAIKGEPDAEASAIEYLVRLARRKNPALFVGLLGKTIEKKINVAADLRETVRIVNLTGLNLADPKIRKRLGPSILGHWPEEKEK